MRRPGRSLPLRVPDDDILVTAYDQGSAVSAAFRPADRKLLADIAEAMAAGALALADGSMVGVGPVLVLADQTPPNAVLQAVAWTASDCKPCEDDGAIAYEVQPAGELERYISDTPAW